MNLKKMIIVGLGLQSSYSSHPQIQQAEKNQILGIINNLREIVTPPMADASKIIWDYALESQLKASLPTNRTTLFDINTQYPPPLDIKVNMNLMHITKAPGYNSIYNYIFHDTCNNAVGDVAGIFKFRINQLNCMNYAKCSDKVFDSFLTCLKKAAPKQNQAHCSWSWRYLSPLVADNLKTIACVRFSHPGPFTPNNQKDSFGCYGDYHNPISDAPYKIKLRSRL